MISFCILLILLSPQCAHAAERLLVGVAATYILPFKEMAAIFEKRTAIAVKPTFAATGNLYSQILVGAPYDLFLAADEDRPDTLFKQKRAEKPFVYATGRLVLWSAGEDACRPGAWQDALEKSMARKIALANPDTSSYGAAAFRTLKRADLWEKSKPHLVFTQDISQSFQYATMGGVALAFISRSFALSEYGEKGCYYMIEESPPVHQAACILKNARNRNAAEAFSAFLVSPEAIEIRNKYGYQ